MHYDNTSDLFSLTHQFEHRSIQNILIEEYQVEEIKQLDRQMASLEGHEHSDESSSLRWGLESLADTPGIAS